MNDDLRGTEDAIDVSDLRPGDIIDLRVPEDIISTFENRMKNAHCLMQEGAALMEDARREFFETIRAEHTELDAFNFSFQKSARTLIVTSRRREGDR